MDTPALNAPFPATLLAPPPRPPPTPLTWRWLCHKCDQVYSLSCTRRCLYCSHYFCSTPSKPPAAQRRRGKRKGVKSACMTEFDYEGWRAWTEWRRDKAEYEVDPYKWKTRALRHLRHIDSLHSGRETQAKRKKMEKWRWVEREEKRHEKFMSNTQNCGDDCDYPSQCHHEQYEASLECSSTTNTATPPSPLEPDSDEGGSNAKLIRFPKEKTGSVPNVDLEMLDTPSSPPDDDYFDTEQPDWDIWEDTNCTPIAGVEKGREDDEALFF